MGPSPPCPGEAGPVLGRVDGSLGLGFLPMKWEVLCPPGPHGWIVERPILVMWV